MSETHNMTYIERELFRFNKQNSLGIKFSLIFLIAIVVNLAFYPSENVGCSFPAAFLNKIFLIWVGVPELLIRLACFHFRNQGLNL